MLWCKDVKYFWINSMACLRLEIPISTKITFSYLLNFWRNLRCNKYNLVWPSRTPVGHNLKRQTSWFTMRENDINYCNLLTGLWQQLELWDVLQYKKIVEEKRIQFSSRLRRPTMRMFWIAGRAQAFKPLFLVKEQVTTQQWTLCGDEWTSPYATLFV